MPQIGNDSHIENSTVGTRVGQVSCMMTGTDLADDLEAGVHHLLDLGGEVAVAQLDQSERSIEVT